MSCKEGKRLFLCYHTARLEIHSEHFSVSEHHLVQMGIQRLHMTLCLLHHTRHICHLQPDGSWPCPVQYCVRKKSVLVQLCLSLDSMFGHTRRVRRPVTAWVWVFLLRRGVLLCYARKFWLSGDHSATKTLLEDRTQVLH
jgi:hypothetical protein